MTEDFGACVASPHHLATEAGVMALVAGGNALDAAVAANLVLGVVAPYLCGFGGDLFAIVWQEGAHAYNGSGRAPATATPESVSLGVGSAEMPAFGPHTVTVPGAVDGWFRLLERFGTRSFGRLAEPALRLAREGFRLSTRGAESIQRASALYAQELEWHAIYGRVAAGDTLRQPELARTIQRLSDEGPDAYYRGPIASAIVETLQERGALLSRQDLAEHWGEWIQPLSARYREVEVLELPPNTQGVAALEALRIFEELPAQPAESAARHHLMLESMKLALSDRDAYVSDPAWMPLPATRLLEQDWVRRRRAQIDLGRAGVPLPGRRAGGGTAYLCAADRDGMVVSLIQSNFVGFGSGVTVPGWGINLHNRGSYFTLDPEHVNVIAPAKRTLHTLIPALVLRNGRPWLAFGTMGGDGQAQTHLQLLVRCVDDWLHPQEAIGRPRWVVNPHDWSVLAESRLGEVCAELRSLGHRLFEAGAYDSALGHAQAILVENGRYRAASDPRAEGAAFGV